MSTIKYLGTEITVSAGTARSGETAFTTDENGLRVFLGGLAEAKRFLRERKAGPTYGPRVASWSVHLDDRKHAIGIYSSHAVALSDLEYFLRDGRAVSLVRTEHCGYQGCDGRGEVHAPSPKHGFAGYVARPCPHHVEPVETVEARHVAAIIAPDPGVAMASAGPSHVVGFSDVRDDLRDTCDEDYA